jgi:hypothetical protein
LRKALDTLERRREFGFPSDQLHADPAAARRALEHDGIADTRRFAPRLPDIEEQLAAGQQGNSRARSDVSCRMLQAKVSDLRRRGTDEHDIGRLAGLCKSGTLAQETVARVDRFGARLARRRNQLVVTQIAFGRRSRPQANRFIGLQHV